MVASLLALLAVIAEAGWTIHGPTTPEDHACESFAPSVDELRDSRPAGWSVEELRQKRWSVSVDTSVGSEETAEGYSPGRCVTGTWTLASGSNLDSCRDRCSHTEGCLGILWGQVESRERSAPRCFLAGVGDSEVVMEYSCPRPDLGCPAALDFRALAELTPTLQCWQRRWWRCPMHGPGGDTDGALPDHLRAVLERLRPRFQSDVSRELKHLLRTLCNPGSFLSLATAMGRTADQFDALRGQLLHALAAKASSALSVVQVRSFSWLLYLLLLPCGILLGRALPRCQQTAPPCHGSQPRDVEPQATVAAFVASPVAALVASPIAALVVSPIAALVSSPFRAVGLSPEEGADEPLEAEDGISVDYTLACLDEPSPPRVAGGGVLPEPQALPEPLPAQGQPVTFGPDTGFSVDVCEVPTPYRVRRNRNATPPRRPVESSPIIQEAEVIDIDDSEHVGCEASTDPYDQPVESPTIAHLRRFWAAIETSPARDNLQSSQRPRQTEMELLSLLNDPDVEVIKRVKHIGDKSAVQIASYCQREGEIMSIAELASKVGLKDRVVKSVLKDYGLPEQ